MITATLLVDRYGKDTRQCLLSSDIYQELIQENEFQQNVEGMLCQIEIPTYSSLPKQCIVYCQESQTLPMDTVQIKGDVIDINHKDEIFIDHCKVKSLNPKLHTPVQLKQITILFDPILYDKLQLLPDENDILKFMSKKFHIIPNNTIIHRNQTLSHKWCKVIDTIPSIHGYVDFEETRVVIVKDTNDDLKPNNVPLTNINDTVQAEVILPITCPELQISAEFTQLKKEDNFDDTLIVFVDKHIMKQMDIINGTLVRLQETDKVTDFKTHIARIYVLLEPNDFDPNMLYITPRLKSFFQGVNRVNLKKLTLQTKDIPTATSIKLSRVNDIYQNEVIYQNIVSNQLKDFFLRSVRIVRKGDLIPIVFDSSLSMFPMSIDMCEYLKPTSKNDSVTWFKVHEVGTNNEDVTDSADPETDNYVFYQIDPSKEIQISSEGIVYEQPIPLKKCDIISYYNLPATFQYDMTVFPYAKTLVDILQSILGCIEKGLSLKTLITIQSTTANTGKTTLVKWVCQNYGLSYVLVDCLDQLSNVNSSDNNTKLLGTIKAKISNNINQTCIPTIVFVSHLEELFTKVDPNQDPTGSKLSISFETEFINLIESFMNDNKKVIFIFSTNNIEEIPSRIRTKINFDIEINVPTEEQRRCIFQWYLSDSQLNFDNSKEDGVDVKFTTPENLDWEHLGIHSAGLTPLDIKSIVQNAKSHCYNTLIQNEASRHALTWDNNQAYINMEQLKKAIDLARDEFSVSIGAPKIPNVTWKDIGGVDIIKGEIMDTIDMPLRHPELFSSGSKQRSGILFYGPPGTGKTLMAKAIATNFSLNFFSVKGPELLNMYIGESEANVRRVFQKAREAKPCVIFFDEIDSVAPKRGNQGDSGGVMDRIVSQLLAELDGMSGDGDGIFVIGATNRPDLLDEALLRPGRFDKLLYLGISDTNEKQLNILTALTRKFKLHSDVDLSKLAEMCPFNYTGADFYALCSDSMLNAMTRIAKTVEGKVNNYNKEQGSHLSVHQWFDKVATEDDTSVLVQMSDFIKAQEELVPSVSAEELGHYLKIKNNFEN